MSFSSKGKRSNSFLPNSYLYKYQLSRISWPLGLLLDLDAFKRHSRFLLFKVNQLFNWLSLAIAAILVLKNDKVEVTTLSFAIIVPSFFLMKKSNTFSKRNLLRNTVGIGAFFATVALIEYV